MSSSLRKAAVQGLVAGLVGYAAVALFMAVVNLWAGRPALYTAAGLGSFFSSVEGFTAGSTGVAGAVLAFGVFGAEVLGVLSWSAAVGGNATWRTPPDGPPVLSAV